MTRPLRSTPITGASPLLRAGPPARCQSGRAPSHVPCERRRPGSCRLCAGHHLASHRAPARSCSRSPEHGHGFDAPSERNDTSTAVRVHSSSWSPPGTPPVPFPHRSPRRSSANAACGGLEPPPEGRLRRAYLHLSHNTDSRRSHLPPHQDLRSSFMAHAPAFSRNVRSCGGDPGARRERSPDRSRQLSAAERLRHPDGQQLPHQRLRKGLVDRKV